MTRQGGESGRKGERGIIIRSVNSAVGIHSLFYMGQIIEDAMNHNKRSAGAAPEQA